MKVSPLGHWKREARTAMTEFLLGYLPVIILFGIALGLSLALLLGAKLLAPASADSEKVSTYECGFNAFDDSRMKFDVQFYLVAILFIIFDIEVVFLFPWALSIGNGTMSVYGWAIGMLFLAELVAGLYYAWKKGALNWN